MLKPLKKLLAALLALLMLTAALPAAAQSSDEAMLQLTFIGMYANSFFEAFITFVAHKKHPFF